MKKMTKALLGLVLLVASAGNAWAQQNPTSPGTTPQWIEYNGNIENVDPGEYTIQFREVDGSCTSDQVEVNVTLTERPVATISSTAPENTVCAGSVVVLTASEADSYLWSTGETTRSITVYPTSTTAYTVTIVKQGCTSLPAEISIQVTYKLPTIVLGSSPELCQGTTLAEQTYLSVTEYPSFYSIDFDEAANLAGLVDVVDAAFVSSPFQIAVPAQIPAGTYNGKLRVKSVGPERESLPIDIQIIVTPAVNLQATVSQSSSYPGMKQGVVSVSRLDGGSGDLKLTLRNSAGETTEYPAQDAIAGLDPGTYSLWAIDAKSCQSNVFEFTITENTSIAFNVVPQEPTSYDGTASIQLVFIGNPDVSGYAFKIDGDPQWGEWSALPANGIVTGVAGGNHTLRLKDGDYEFPESVAFFLQTYQPIQFELTAQVEACQPTGTVVVADLTGGNGSYEYLLVSDQEKLGGRTFILGREYNWVKVGDQYWLAENLQATDGESGIYSPNGNVGNQSNYGLLYTYSAAQRLAQQLEGWHLPSDEEWAQLSLFTGGNAQSGLKLKDADAWGATGLSNPFGFSALPAGQRLSPDYLGFSNQAYFWAFAEPDEAELAASRVLSNTDQEFKREFADKTYARSVRLVKDATTSISYEGTWKPLNSDGKITDLPTGTHQVVIRDSRAGQEVLKTVTLTINPPLEANISAPSRATCAEKNDGSFKLLGISGGSGKGYRYKLDQRNSIGYSGSTISFNGLLGGDHQLLISDSEGCQKLLTVNVPAPEPFAIDYSKTVAQAYENTNEGEVTLHAITGGTKPYQMTFDGQSTTYAPEMKLNNLASGDHTLSVSDLNGCTYSQVINIGQIDQLVFEVENQTQNCDRTGSILVKEINGGVSGAFEYALDGAAWLALPTDRTIPNLEGGAHQLVLRDEAHNTSEAVAFTVQTFTDISFAATNRTQACDIQGSLEINDLSGGNGTYSYWVGTSGTEPDPTLGNWTDLSAATTHSIQTPGTYWIWVKDGNNCLSQSQSVPVAFNSAVQAQMVNYRQTIYPGANSVQVTIQGATGGSGAPYSYSLDGGNAYQAFPGADILANNLPFGNYSLIVKDGAGCTSQVYPFIVTPLSELKIAAANTTDVLCYGGKTGSIEVAISGGSESGYRYSVNGGTPVVWEGHKLLENLEAGNYTLVAYDSQNLQSEAVTISIGQSTENVVDGTIVSNATCFGGSDGKIQFSLLNTQNGPFTYYLNNEVWSNYNAQSGLRDGLSQGTYTFHAIDSKGCKSQEVVRTIGEPAPFEIDAEAGDPIVCSGGTTTIDLTQLSGRTEQLSFYLDGNLIENTVSVGVPIPNISAGTHLLWAVDAKQCQSNQVTINVTEPAPVAVVLAADSKVDVNCKNAVTGQINVSEVTGGSGESYLLYVNDVLEEDYTIGSHSIPNLGAGTYTLYAQDEAGCVSAQISETILEPTSPLSVSIQASQHVTCSGGQNGKMKVTGVSGGRLPNDTDPYQISIDQGSTWVNYTPDFEFTDLKAGDYQVWARIGTRSGCNAVSNQETIKPGNAIQIELGDKTAVACFGSNTGSIVLKSVTGSIQGMDTYQYTIDRSDISRIDVLANSVIGGLGAGSHTIFAFDENGCMNEKQFQIEADYNLSFDVAEIKNAKCADGNSDGSFKITNIQNTAPSTYKYCLSEGGVEKDLGANGLVNNRFADTYSVQIIDATGCKSEPQTVTVGRSEELVVDFTKTDYTCHNDGDGTLTINNVSGSYPNADVANYQIKTDNTGWSNLILGDKIESSLLKGSYKYYIASSDRCATKTIGFDILDPEIVEISKDSIHETCIEYQVNQTGIQDLEIHASGGTGSYSYSLGIPKKDGKEWTPFTGYSTVIDTFLIPQKITLRVKDSNGCLAINNGKEVQILKTDILRFEHTSYDALCSTGKGYDLITKITGGGSVSPTATYKYSFNGGETWTSFESSKLPLKIEGLSQDTIDLQIRDHLKCVSAKESFIIYGGRDLDIQSEAIIPVPCSGDLGRFNLYRVNGDSVGDVQIAITNSENDPKLYQTYQLPTRLDNLGKGSYYIWVQIEECDQLIRSFVIPELYSPFQIESEQIDPVCYSGKGQVNIDGVAGGDEDLTGLYYRWNNNDFKLLEASGKIEFKDLVQGSFNQLTFRKLISVEGVQQPITCQSKNFDFQIKSVSPISANFALDSMDCGMLNTKFQLFDLSGGSGSGYEYKIERAVSKVIEKDWIHFPNMETNQLILEPGSYNLLVKDNQSCDTTINFKVASKTLLYAKVDTSIQLACHGQLATIQINDIKGGSGSGYKYRLDQGIISSVSNLSVPIVIDSVAAGKHCVIITDGKGCTRRDSVFVKQPEKLQAYISDVLHVCKGDTAHIRVDSIKGGTQPYRYYFDNASNDALPLSNGSVIGGLLAQAAPYTLHVIDSLGCGFQNSIKIDTIAKPLKMMYFIRTAGCVSTEGKIGVKVIAQDGADYEYKLDKWTKWVSITEPLKVSEIESSQYMNIRVKNSPVDDWRIQLSKVAIISKLRAYPNFKEGMVCFFSNGGGDGKYAYYKLNGKDKNRYNKLASDGLVCTLDSTHTPGWVRVSSIPNLIEFGDSLSCSMNSCSFNIGSGSAPTFEFDVLNPTQASEKHKVKIHSLAGGSGAGYTHKFDYNNWVAIVADTALINDVATGEHTLVVKDNLGCSSQPKKVTIEQTLTAAISVVQKPTCKGRSDLILKAVCSYQKADSKLSYSWYKWDTQALSYGERIDTSVQIGAQSAGKFKVEVQERKDGMLIYSAVAELDVPDTEELTYDLNDAKNVLCHDGASGVIKLIAKGGNGAYKYYSGDVNSNNFVLDGVFDQLVKGDYQYTIVDALGCNATTQIISIGEPEQSLSFVPTPQNPSQVNASDGSILIEPQGGTPIYSMYATSESGVKLPNASGSNFGIANLRAGSYTIKLIDDNKCEYSEVVTLINPPAITIAKFDWKNPRCFDEASGVISIQPTGGTPYTEGEPYRYTWKFKSPSGTEQTLAIDKGYADNLAAGDFTITVTDSKNISVDVTYTLEQPQKPVLTVATTLVSCFGATDGKALVQSTVDSLKYYMNDVEVGTEITNLSSGNYSIVALDFNNCETTATFNISQPTLPLSFVATATNPSNAAQTDGFIKTTITGGWGNYKAKLFKANASSVFDFVGEYEPAGSDQTIGNLSPGTYRLEVFDRIEPTGETQCSVVQDLTLYSTQSLTVSIEEAVKLSCASGSTGKLKAIVKGGSGTDNTYQWYKDGKKLNSEKSVELVVNAVGSYKVEVEQGSGSTKMQGSATFDLLRDMPVIASSQVTDVGCYGDADGSIVPVVTGGKAPLAYKWNTGSRQSQLINLQAGSYNLEVIDAAGCVAKQDYSITEPASSVSISLDDATITYPTGENTNGSIIFNGNKEPASGGWGNYTYKWTDVSNAVLSNTKDLENVGVGRYFLTVRSVKDPNDSNSAQCSVSKEIIVVNPGEFLFDLEITGENRCPSDQKLTFKANVYSNTFSLGAAASSAKTNNGNNKSDDTKEKTNNGKSNASTNASASNSVNAVSDYTFTWMNTVTNEIIGSEQILAGQADGSYKVIVAAGTAIVESEFEIANPYALRVRPVVEPVRCHGASTGIIKLNVGGGIAPYNIQWDNSVGEDFRAHEMIYDLPAGTYSVTITDASNCSLTESFTITQPDQPIAIEFDGAVKPSNYDTNDGSVNAHVSGGTQPWLYVWYDAKADTCGTSNPLQGMSYQSYSLVITDKYNCIGSKNFDFGTPPLFARIDVGRELLCLNHSNAQLKAFIVGGTAGYTIEWFKQKDETWEKLSETSALLNNASAGTYKLMVTDANGQQVEDSYSVVPKSNLTVTTLIEHAACDGTLGSAEALVQNGEGAYTFAWKKDQDATFTASGSKIENLNYGTYTVTVTDDLKCRASAFANISQSGTLSVNSTLLPNTCSTESGMGTGSIEVEVTGGSGDYAYQWSRAGKVANLGQEKSISDLDSGIYRVVVIDQREGYNCRFDGAYTLTEPELKKWFEQIPDSKDFCFGALDVIAEVAIPNVPEGMNVHYSWKSGDVTGTGAGYIPIRTGTYNLSVTDFNLCDWTKNIEVKQNTDVLNVQFLLPSMAFLNQSVFMVNTSFVNGLDNYSDYKATWLINEPGGSFKSDSSNMAEIVFTTPGTYHIALQLEKGGCVQQSESKTIIISDSENPNGMLKSIGAQLISISASPNPTTTSTATTVQVDLNELCNFNYLIVDGNTGILKSKEMIVPNGLKWERTYSNFPYGPGAYILVAYTANEVKTFKLIVK